MVLDSVDQKILFELMKNSRQSTSTLSKKTGFTRDVVEYRIEKFESLGIIKTYLTRINQAQFCQGMGTIYFKLLVVSEKRFIEIVELLKKHESVNWLAELCGNIDLVCTVLYEDSLHLAKITAELSEIIGQDLKEQHLALYISEFKFDRLGLLSEKSFSFEPREISFKKDTAFIVFDDIDRKILFALKDNSRSTNVFLSENTGLSQDGVRLRIKRLERKDVIQGYTIAIDSNKIGFESYYMGLKINNLTEEVISKIKYFSQISPYVVFCARTAGKYDLVMTISVRNRIHFKEVLKEINKQLSDELQSYEFQLMMNEHKEIFLPEGFFTTHTS